MIDVIFLGLIVAAFSPLAPGKGWLDGIRRDHPDPAVDPVLGA